MNLRLTLAAILALLATPAFAATSYLVTQTTITISESNICKQVSNTGAGTRYISTKTAAEWQSYIDNPNGLGMTCCGGGTNIGGYCWYYTGTLAQSCDTVCATHGGCNATGTINYAGSGGTLANCQAIATAFGKGTVADSTSTGGVGCSYLNTGNAFRITSPATTCADTGSKYARFCACNN
jgi:hypothetical protein